jgi:hypothetical protein
LSKLLDSQELKDQQLTYILSFMDTVLVNAFLLGDSYKETFAFFSLRTLQLTIKHGLSALYAPTAVISWGTFHAAMGDFDTAYEAEKVALEIVDKLQARGIQGRAILISYGTIHFWRMKLDERSCHTILLGYHLAMSYGDVFFAQLGLVGWIVSKTYFNEPFFEFHSRVRALVSELNEEHANRALMLILPSWQFVSTTIPIFLNLNIYYLTFLEASKPLRR